MRIACFMATPWGRGLRIVLGLALIAAGLLLVHGLWGWVMAAIGLVPIAMGAFNLCAIAVFLHQPFCGSKLHC